jgi:flagellar biosynthetic protein FliR
VIEASFAPGTLVAFLLAMARTTAWLTMAPPFARTLMPVRVRVGFGVAIGFLLAGSMDVSTVDLGIGSLALAIGYQVFIGVALGFVVQLFFSAFQAAGSIIDFSSGFSAGAIYDPISGGQNATVSRFYNLTATVLLFVGGGHLLILSGYMRSFQAAPLGGPSIDQLGQMLLGGIGTFFIAAIEIAFPLAAAMLMTEIGLALLARAAPQANVLMLGLTLKALVLLLLLGMSLSILPSAVEMLADQATRTAFMGW